MLALSTMEVTTGARFGACTVRDRSPGWPFQHNATNGHGRLQSRGVIRGNLLDAVLVVFRPADVLGHVTVPQNFNAMAPELDRTRGVGPACRAIRVGHEGVRGALLKFGVGNECQADVNRR